MAHKIELKVNREQRVYLAKACGISRLAYNWGLARWNELYELNKNLPKEQKVKISGFSLNKEFNSIKKEKFPFVYEVTKYASQKSFLDLENAFKRFFKGNSKYPKFHKKFQRDSFYIGNDVTKIVDRKIWIPNLGFIKMKESLRFEGKINSVTISRRANKWFASIQVEITTPTIKRKYDDSIKRTVGVDLGIKTLLTTSDGVMIENPRFLDKENRKLRRAQRKLSKKYEAYKKYQEEYKNAIKSLKKDEETPFKKELKDFKNYNKQKLKIARLHYKIACKRSDTIHKITNYLTKNYDEIIIENLNVKGMVKNHNLAKSLSDVSFGEFKRQLEYKSIREGSKLILADRFYASSKICSHCGHKKDDLKLSERTFECEQCGYKIDRDLNASINLRKLSKDLVGGVPAEFTPVKMDYNFKELSSLKVSVDKSGIKALDSSLRK